MSENLLKRVSLVVLGQIIISSGITLMLYLNIGADPMGVFHTGVAHLLNVNFATAFFLNNIVVLTIVFMLDKKYINIATIITMFTVTLTTGFFDSIYSSIIPENLNIVVKLILFIVACFILSIGLNCYIIPDLGVGGMDIVSEMPVDKKGLNYRNVKVLTDIGFLFIGFIFGGVIGIGTIISALVVGPFIHMTRPKMRAAITRFLEPKLI